MNCIKCGTKETDTKYYKPIADKMAERQMCFTCNHWQGLIEKEKDFVIVNGRCYTVRGNINNAKMSGHGGRTFYILKDNGDKITSSNLWHSGDVPKPFTEDLKDNACFLRSEAALEEA